MCRKRVLAATALMLTPLLLGAPAAFAWGSPPAQASGAAATANSNVQGQPQSTDKGKGNAKATAAERTAADRLEPLARAAFWASQVSADPKDGVAGVKLAAALRVLGRYQEAYDAAEHVSNAQPKNIEALLEMARVCISDGQGFFAVEPARKAMALAPKDWRGPSLLAVGLEQAGRFTEALAAHGQAMALAPHNPVVLSNAAMFYAAQGDKAQAEALLRKAVAQPDASVQVRQNLALILGLEGKLAESEQIQRQDLPPQMADNNLAYLRAASAAAASPQPVTATVK
jgi:Flp pilus assembly protein TadD